jgi:hypothetical protein
MELDMTKIFLYLADKARILNLYIIHSKFVK